MRTLLRIASHFNESKITWGIGASALLDLNHIPVEVHDLDIMVIQEDFIRALQVLEKLGVEHPKEPHPNFKTLLFRSFELETCHVDLMSGMTVKWQDQWHEFTFTKDHIDQMLEIDGVELKLMRLEDWYQLYHWLERPDKIKSIEEYAHRVGLELNQSFLESKVLMRTICVTGGAQGIGRSIVERFLSLGDRVIFCDRNVFMGEQLIKTLNHPELHFLQVDFSHYDEVRAMFETIQSRFGNLDVLVNNAALQVEARFEELDVQDWQNVINTNINGTFYCIKEAAKIMKTGSIVNISSLYSHKVRLNKFSYDASKAAIQRMSEEFALALAPTIRVNTIEPGAVDTPMNQIFTQAEVREAVLKRIPLGRIGTGDDIAKAVVFLCSEEADYITGSTLKVDGGRGLL